MNHTLVGSAAGAGATIPMTMFMKYMHKNLPAKEQYPLPPREITEKIIEDVGLKNKLSEKEKSAATTMSHYGYGASAGVLYATTFSRLPGPPLLKGAAYGMLVWGGSYLKLLPSLHILKPATDHPARRNRLMIGAHLVWGCSLALLVDKMDR